MYKDLKEKWGWNEDPSPQQFAQTHTAARQQKEAQEAQQRQLQEQAQAAQQMQQGYQQNLNLPMPQHPPPQSMGPPPAAAPTTSAAAPSKKMPQGIPNPMYAKADFNLPQHPYQNFYVAPNHVSGQWNHGETGGQQPYYNV